MIDDTVLWLQKMHQPHIDHEQELPEPTDHERCPCHEPKPTRADQDMIDAGHKWSDFE